MLGILHILERPHPAAKRLASQQIEFQDPPRRWERFRCQTAYATAFATDRLELDPSFVDDSSVFFRTKHTAYILQRVSLAAPDEL